ncbi:nicotinate-nucleotide pyrophosphorylase [carboxylating] [Caldicellulosiruptor bescii]|uniref:nicotinate-nucleotide diphosphorylase (carboxylating) n=2 Tax=Caldicellulosiruptor bescii TaxID=31899 RepID=A0ABY1S9B4_CALBS|nr:carboxylating nicotinate-nucleotide diphosphorylase [Caldicellulosiruptor bescii]ACM60314.1 nicotinate-nucleotide pyrophosphorylase [Caldicellulosiruptor bescii DSM 6725]PBC87728.1 nicotinate-nucleotide pyrophosphorylase [carboxylating] [Caldicellulosiruptor bescii]PBC90661.1 nicotinate-nucleotide pyrophosphorylase [carboxylating] [Caldicellulosiruptor bescii]PBD03907.1 nicotinate-nucleotide pyrophosphorylase [carboxylating] [Caldicellulosiruptor bescii]PBD06458.1 nicotinate-nucleotide pyro
MLNFLVIDKIIRDALIEDMPYGDITTDLLIPQESTSSAVLLAKESGILCGIDVAKRVFEILDSNIKFEKLKTDGDNIQKGDVLAKIQGKTRAILMGERLALNILQRMSGIATFTNMLVQKVKGYRAAVTDTRKTIPLLRMLDKYAVFVGGGKNHRYSLSDAVLIKDNHIKAVGSITEAVKRAKENVPHTMKVEVEVRNMQEFEEALAAGADIIMLDHFTVDEMKMAVEKAEGRVLIEASGNINIDSIEEIAKTGVDIISVGSITHSVKSLDISLDFVD